MHGTFGSGLVYPRNAGNDLSRRERRSWCLGHIRQVSRDSSYRSLTDAVEAAEYESGTAEPLATFAFSAFRRPSAKLASSSMFALAKIDDVACSKGISRKAAVYRGS